MKPVYIFQEYNSTIYFYSFIWIEIVMKYYWKRHLNTMIKCLPQTLMQAFYCPPRADILGIFLTIDTLYLYLYCTLYWKRYLNTMMKCLPLQADLLGMFLINVWTFYYCHFRRPSIEIIGNLYWRDKTRLVCVTYQSS